MRLKPNIAAMKAYSPGRVVPGAVKLSSNENPLGPSPAAMKAAADILGGINRYPDGSARELKSRLSGIWDMPEDGILVTNGSDEAFLLLCAAYIGAGENAVGMRETFSEYRFVVKLFGAEMREASVDNGLYNLDAMTGLTDGQTRIIFICNPNNPTGTYRTHAEIEKFLDTVSPDILVVLDEAYAEFADRTDFPNSRGLLETYPNLVVSRTFSKLYGLAGLRVGYLIGSPDIITGAARASMPFNVNSLAQAAAAAALDDREFRERSLDLTRSERRFISEELSARGISHYPSQANFVCINLQTPVAPLWDTIARQGIALRDLASFGLSSMARCTCGSRENNRKLLDVLDNLKEKGLIP